jgi:hypothetical protein
MSSLAPGLEVGYFPYREDPVYIGYYKINSKRKVEEYKRIGHHCRS